MSKNFFYAVKQGHKTGIYTTWDACKQQVEGYSGALYKGFTTLAEAEAFLYSTPTLKEEKPEKELVASEAVAYVDGSYEESLNEFSFRD